MMFKFNWISVLYWLLIPILLMVGSQYNGWLDLQIQDTYFVFSKYDVTILMSFILLIYSLGYLVFNKMKGNSTLLIIHFLCTILGIIGLLKVLWLDAIPVIEFSMTPVIISITLIGAGFIAYILNMATKYKSVSTS